MSKILLFGGSGMLGTAIQEEAKKLGHEVVAPSSMECNITIEERINRYMPSAEFAINAAGQIPISGNLIWPYTLTNGIGAGNVAACAKRNDVPLIHISTDCVFSGRRQSYRWYTVEDIPDPIDLYGVSKRYGEVAVQSVYPEATIVRTSFVGMKNGLLRWFLDQPRGAVVDGYGNAIWSGSTVNEVAKLLLMSVMLRNPGGIQHLATAGPISKYDLLNIFKDLFRPDIVVNYGAEPVIHRALEPTILLRDILSSLKE